MTVDGLTLVLAGNALREVHDNFAASDERRRASRSDVRTTRRQPRLRAARRFFLAPATR